MKHNHAATAQTQADAVAGAGLTAGTGTGAGAGGQGQDRGPAQAAAVQQVVAASHSDRIRINPAIDQVRSCSDRAGGAQVIGEVTVGRRRTVDAANALTVNALDQGTELKATLVEALSASLEADQHYLNWARDVLASGCGAATDEYAAGNDVSTRATQTKRHFVDLWAPIAGRYGLPVPTEPDI